MFAREKPVDSLLSLRVWADLVAVLVFSTVASTYISIDQHYRGIFVVLVGALVSFGYILGTAVRSMVWLGRDQPRRVVASLTKLTIILLLWYCGFAPGDYVHLALFYPIYRHEIDARPADSTVPTRFFWGDKALWVTDGLQADTLVYDPTDALARTIGEVRNGTGTGLGLWTRHLIGHFYVEREFSR